MNNGTIHLILIYFRAPQTTLMMIITILLIIVIIMIIAQTSARGFRV